MLNSIVVSKSTTIDAVVRGLYVKVFLADGSEIWGKLEDTATGQRVTVITDNGDRLFGYYINGEVFQQPEENKPPKWSFVPLVTGEVVSRDDTKHHWVPALNCFVESQTAEVGKFIPGVKVEIQPAVLDEIPDLEHRLKKLKLYIDHKAAKRRPGWVKTQKENGVETAEFDAIIVARVMDMGLSALELMVQIAKAVEAVVGVSSIFGLKGSIKERFQKKLKAIELRDNQLG